MTTQFVTFTSDFGLDDEFVGVCHSVIARLAPHVRILDLAHGAPSVRAGSTMLAQSAPYAPEGCVHLAVVDPGMDNGRRGLAVLTGSASVLVGPDNGLLVEAAMALGGISGAWELVDPAYRLEPVSPTFHGRDVFSPAAAYIASGLPPSKLGPPVEVGSIARLPSPLVEAADGVLVCEVLRTDRFGNVQLAAAAADADRAGLRGELVVEPGYVPARRVETFGDLEPGALGLYADPYGHVSLAVNGGGAHKLVRGPIVTVRRSDAG